MRKNPIAKAYAGFHSEFRKPVWLSLLFCLLLGSSSQGKQVQDSNAVLDVLKSGLRNHKAAFCVRAQFIEDSMWVDSIDEAKDFSNWSNRPEGKSDPLSGVGRVFFGKGISGYFNILHNPVKKSTDSNGMQVTERPSCFVIRGNGLSIEGHDLNAPSNSEVNVFSYEWPVAFVSKITGSSSMRNLAGLSPLFFFDLDYADSFFDPYEHRSDLTLDAERKKSEISVTCKLKDSNEIFANFRFDISGKYPILKEWVEGDSTVIIGASQESDGLEFSFPSEVRLIQKFSTLSSAVKFRVIRWRFSSIDFLPPDQKDTEVPLSKNAKISGYTDSTHKGSISLFLLDPEKLKSDIQPMRPTTDSIDESFLETSTTIVGNGEKVANSSILAVTAIGVLTIGFYFLRKFFLK